MLHGANLIDAGGVWIVLGLDEN